MIILPVYIQEAPDGDGTYAIYDTHAVMLCDLLTRDGALNLARRLNSMQVIRVFVKGGVVQNVHDIPLGVTVEIYDFDGDDGLPHEQGKCALAIYGSDVSVMECDDTGRIKTRAEKKILDAVILAK